MYVPGFVLWPLILTNDDFPARASQRLPRALCVLRLRAIGDQCAGARPGGGNTVRLLPQNRNGLDGKGPVKAMVRL